MRLQVGYGLVMRTKLSRALFVFGAVTCASLSAQFNVTQVSPTSETTAASAVGDITWTLSAPINPATVTSSSVMVWGRWSGVMSGTRSLENGNTVIRFVPLEPFSAGEQITATLTPALMSSGGVALAESHNNAYWIASPPAVQTLVQQSVISIRFPSEGLIRSYGAYAGDLDNDGFCDLLIPNEDVSDVRRFMNDGAGGFSAFTVHSLPFGSKPSSNEGADFNDDGYTDFAVANISGNSVGVFLNDGTGDLLPAIVIPVGNGPRGLTVLDVDSDGDTDIMTANRVSGTLSLILNNGNGTFQPSVSFQGGVSNETSIVAADANGDGIMDLFVGGYGSQNVALMLGDGAGNFAVSATVSAGGRPWMMASGDVDLDGHVDVVACLSNASSISVMRNNGAGGFLPAVTYPCGLFSLAIDLGDLDGDGDLDILSSSYSGRNFYVFRNQGDGTYGTPQVLPATGAGSCAIFADINGDEDMEVVGIDELADLLYIFDSPPLPVQQESLGAAMQINAVGGSPGFNGALPLSVSLGSTMGIEVKGHPGEAYLLPFGFGINPGLPGPAGTLGLAPNLLLLADGLSNPLFTLDANGEATVNVLVPAFLPPGLQITLQGLTTNPANLAIGFTFSNPITIELN
ncbi:MAG: hypothetical protein ACJA0V_000750 [Planctomycetota bacterium]|jgi:hypothetical protein